MFDDIEKLREDYAGIEVIYEGHRFVYSVHNLLDYIQGLSKVSSETNRNDKPHKDFRIGVVKNLKNGEEITPWGNMSFWQVLAEELEQQKTKKEPVAHTYALNIGGRKLIAETPSKRYIYDQGSKEQLEEDLAGETPYELAKDKQIASDARSKWDQVTYPGIRENLHNSRLEQKEITWAIRDALKGGVPASKAVRDKISNQAKEDTNKLRELKERYKSGELTPEELSREVGNLKIFNVETKDLQEWGSDHLTVGMYYKPRNAPEDFEYGNSIPLLTASWFVAEYSRNQASFIVGKMLLDLIEVDAELQSNGMPVTFENSIWHPDIPIDTQQGKDASYRDLKKIGGLHPMCHMGSYNVDFKDDPYKLDQNNLSWSHVKSGIIICEWFKRYFARQGIEANILDKAGYEVAWHGSPVVDGNEKQLAYYRNELKFAGKLLSYIYQAPSHSADEEAVTVANLACNEHSSYYCLAADTADLMVRKGLMQLALDSSHACILTWGEPTYNASLELEVEDAEGNAGWVGVSADKRETYYKKHRPH